MPGFVLRANAGGKNGGIWSMAYKIRRNKKKKLFPSLNGALSWEIRYIDRIQRIVHPNL